MSTLTPTVGTAPVSTGPQLRRALAGEWTRLRTLRSTGWCLLAAAAFMSLIGASSGSEGQSVWHAAENAIGLGQFPILLVPILAVTGEYATGAIRSTAQWLPRRSLLLTARVLVPVTLATVTAVVLAIVTDLVALVAAGPDGQLSLAAAVPSLGAIAAYVLVGAVISVGVALTLRSTAGTLLTMVFLMFIGPVLLTGLGIPWLATVGEHLPGLVMVSIMDSNELSMDAGRVALVAAGWVIAALAAGGISLHRRDIP